MKNILIEILHAFEKYTTFLNKYLGQTSSFHEIPMFQTIGEFQNLCSPLGREGNWAWRSWPKLISVRDEFESVSLHVEDKKTGPMPDQPVSSTPPTWIL